MTRHAGLDAARAIGMVLVVTGHAAVSYLVTPIGWAVQDGRRHLGFDAYALIVDAFILPAFFWLSGYFARAGYERLGRAGYLRQRATRLAVPLAVAIVPCSLALDALWDWGRELAARAQVAPNMPRLEGSKLPLTLGHLWYLYYLLAISLAALVVVEIGRRLRPAAPRAAWTAALAAPITAIVSTAPLIAAGAWRLDTPLGFGIDPGVAVYHAAFFGWGWFAHAHGAELDRLARHAWRALAVALVALAVLLPALSAGAGAGSGRTLVHVIAASGVLTTALVFGFIGLCVRHARRAHPVIAFVSAASYWTYIVHLPVVVLLQIAFSTIDGPAPIEYLAIVSATMAVCLVSYAAVARAAGSLAASRRARGTPHPARSARTP